MSFAALKKASKTSFKQLAEKMANEGKKTNYDDDRFWRPEVDKSGSGFAIIRFLPVAEGEESPFIKLFNHGFKINGKWYIENCPTSMGSGNPCPVCEANTALWNTGIEENKEIVRKRKRTMKYISNVIVLSDSKHPENEGKVFLFTYGTKIFNKLMNAINPEFEDEKSFDPFSFWGGAPFKLKIRNVEGYKNYDKSEFGECGPLFEDDDAMEAVWKSQYPLQEFLNPKNFKPYEELKTKFYSVINAKPVLDSKENGGDDDDEPTPKSAPVRQSKPSANTVKTAASKDDEDDFELYRSMLDD
jgi:hypothetical protein